MKKSVLCFAVLLPFISCSEAKQESPEIPVLGKMYLSTVPGGVHGQVSPERAYLGWPESIAYNLDIEHSAGYFPVSPLSCGPATYDVVRRKLTAPTFFRSLLSMNVPECANPGSADYNLYCACDPAHPLHELCGRRVRGPVELKVYLYNPVGVFDRDSNQRVGDLPRTSLIGLNRDYGCFHPGCFWNDPEFPGYDLPEYIRYKTLHPGWDFGPASNEETALPDIALEPGEETGCIDLVFSYDTAGGLLTPAHPTYMPGIALYADVLGFLEGYGVLQVPPVVGDTPAVTARPMIQVRGTLAAGADRLRVSIGSTEAICADNATCDRASATGVVEMDVWLDHYGDYRLYIHQSNGTDQSPAVMRVVRRVPRFPSPYVPMQAPDGDPRG
jgi:hypothetical protein